MIKQDKKIMEKIPEEYHSYVKKAISEYQKIRMESEMWSERNPKSRLRALPKIALEAPVDEVSNFSEEW
jgi:hypothetical protein